MVYHHRHLFAHKKYTKYTKATRQVKPSRTARLTGALTAALKFGKLWVAEEERLLQIKSSVKEDKIKVA